MKTKITNCKCDEKYNGWSNYATWRVNLEMFSCIEFDEQTFESIQDLSEYMKEYAEEIISVDLEQLSSTLVIDYARAFLEEVNWYEIATHVVENNPSIISTVEEFETVED